jgi:adenine deaminase
MNARQRLADVARGRVLADLVLTNGRIFDVLSGDLVEGDLALFGDRIAGIGRYDGLQTFDVRGRIILPGFIDGGAVLETSLLSLGGYCRAVSTHGTTLAVFDFRGIAAVLGLQGLAAISAGGSRPEIDVRCALPLTCAPLWDTAPGRFGSLEPMHLSLPGLVACGGDLDGRTLLDAGGEVLDTSQYEAYLPVIVEAAGVTEEEAAALLALGVVADRAWHSPQEALAKLRQGLWLLAPEGSMASSATDLKWLSKATRLDRVCLVSGPCSAADLVADGHLDAALRRVVHAGVPAGDAVRMVTSQPAALFGLHDRGALLPGRRADVVVVDDLRNFHINLVIKDGRPIARQGVSLLPVVKAEAMQGRQSMHAALIMAEHLVIAGHAGACRIIALEADGTTTVRFGTPSWHDGRLGADPARDIVKVAVLERHTASGRLGKGFVQGLGLREGALCCSFAGSGQNLIVAGIDDASMLAALHQVVSDGGGMAVARDGQVSAALPLPYAGLLSVLPAADLVVAVRHLYEAAWELGCEAAHPFSALASLAHTSAGALRLTEQGLVDTVNQRLVALQD